METKLCCDCGETKTLEEFNICAKRNDKIWRSNFCGKCAWIRRKNSKNPSNYYYAKNKEGWNAYQREYAKKRYWEKKKQLEN